MAIDRKVFFDHVRSSGVAGRPLKQKTVDSLNAVLDAWNRFPKAPLEEIAYTLATARHEAWHPRREQIEYDIGEIGGGDRPYGKTGFFGRGLTQLTHQANYERAGKFLGVDLVKNPHLACRKDISAGVLVVGSVLGWFRADSKGRHKLGRYFGPHGNDPVGARNIINGDMAKNGGLVAGHYRKFLAALKAAASVPQEYPMDTTTAEPAPVTVEEPALAAFEVEAIQKRLRELGYFEVGKVDGMWGSRTTAAIAALQHDHGLTVDGKYSDAVKNVLATAKPREIAPERAGTTEGDLVAQGSSVVIGSKQITLASVIEFITGAAALVTFVAQNWQTESLPFPLNMVVNFLPPWLIPILMMGFAAFKYLKAKGVISDRILSERIGLHNGEPDPAPSPPVKHAPERIVRR
jgi:putative chitinase